MGNQLLLDIGKEEIFYSILDQKTLTRSGKCRYSFGEPAEDAAKTILNEISGSVFERVLLPGGLLRPISCDSFFVNDEMVFDAQNHVYGKSEYNFLTVVAHHIAVTLRIPAIAIKPLSSDALKSSNRINGIREIEKKSRYLACRHHGACLYSEMIFGRPYDELNLIVADLGSVTSVGAHCKGRCVDVNDSLGAEGPMGFLSSGDVPTHPFIEKILAEELTPDKIEELLFTRSGLSEHGITSAQEADEDLESNPEAKLAVSAYAYQIAKSIGSAAVSLDGQVDAVILCGEGAKSKIITDSITDKIQFLARVILYQDFDMMTYLKDSAQIVGEKLWPVREY